jgi:hypothetical protein
VLRLDQIAPVGGRLPLDFAAVQRSGNKVGAVIAGFFFLAGLAFVIVSRIPSLTDSIDRTSTPDSDPSSGVFLLLGGIWAAVGLALLVAFTVLPALGRTGIFHTSSSSSSDDYEDETLQQQLLEQFRANAGMGAVGSAVGAGTGAAGSTVERLDKLGELHKSGVLSDSEFAAEKAKILADK